MKYKHTKEVLTVLNDLSNRVQQLIEANERYLENGHDDSLIEAQNTSLQSVLVLIKQVKDNGHVFRGNEYFPDDVEPLATTKFNGVAMIKIKQISELRELLPVEKSIMVKGAINGQQNLGFNQCLHEVLAILNSMEEK
jgi:hypothetical protein